MLRCRGTYAALEMDPMFLEIDDGVYLNLNNVFHISWQAYENRGLWIFHAGAGEPHPPGPAATRWLPVQSWQFSSREEGEAWLRKILDDAGLLLCGPSKRSSRKPFPGPGISI